jgi:hypothetical protein
MPDKKKKGNTTPKPSAFVQVASDGASINVKESSAKGKMAAKAKKLMKMKEAGKKLLQSEKNIIKKYWNPTKKRKK